MAASLTSLLPRERSSVAVVPDRTRRGVVACGAMALLLVVLVVLGGSLGALAISPREVLLTLVGSGTDIFTSQILWSIRFPRVALALVVGAGLGLAGAACQGVFRNPLADPAIIGVSPGAMVAAVGGIVLGFSGIYWVPMLAFAGALAAAFSVQLLASRREGTSTGMLILAGIAVNSFCGAVAGLLLFVASETQLRSATNWSLGTLGGGSWSVVALVGVALAAALAILIASRRELNALALGEREMGHLGLSVEALRRRVIVAVALVVGAAVAFTGIIGFVGLVVPHLVRLTIGPDHRWLLPASALGGACLLLAADTAARTMAAPAEIPVGVVTALVGSPFFVWLLWRGREATA